MRNDHVQLCTTRVLLVVENKWRVNCRAPEYEGLMLINRSVYSESGRSRGDFPRVVCAGAMRGHAQCHRSLGWHSRTPWPASRAVGRKRAGTFHIGAVANLRHTFRLAQFGQNEAWLSAFLTLDLGWGRARSHTVPPLARVTQYRTFRLVLLIIGSRGSPLTKSTDTGTTPQYQHQSVHGHTLSGTG